ncbi:MAG: hypothetical protein GC155_13450 [Alphaproteobacteria bacterium]|nr:hypothetical protein [Alphaproteobacteria bacterium]
MSSTGFVSSAIAFVWAGVVLGGSLIATPAKFQAPSLSLPVALEVGRAQFLWIGVAEIVLCVAFLLCTCLLGRFDWRIATPAPLLLVVQRLVLMPALDARTSHIIAGQQVAPSSLHVAYVVLELVKLMAILAAGIAGFRFFRTD